MRPNRWIAIAAWLLWAFLAFHGCHRLDARPAGKEPARDVDERRPRYRLPIGREREERHAVEVGHLAGFAFRLQRARTGGRGEGVQPDQTEWDVALARQCGILRTNKDLDGPHVSHRRVGDTIEATVRWNGPNQFELDGVFYTRAAE